MTKCPKIGTKVSYPGGLAVGPCVGTVEGVYPTYVWDEINDKETNQAEPEREWHVAMRPDIKPAKWAYPGRDRFAPCVADLKRIKHDAKPIKCDVIIGD